MLQAARKAHSRNPFVRFQSGFEKGFTGFRNGYVRLLTLCVDYAGVFLIIFVVFALGSVSTAGAVAGTGLLSRGGRGPIQDSRARPHRNAHRRDGRLCDHIDATIREHIPSNEVVTIVDNIGLPYSGLESVLLNLGADRAGGCRYPGAASPKHHPTDEYVQDLRGVLAREYPGVTFYMLPVDIVTQILNFGLSAPIDIQIVGPNLYGNRAVAEKMLNEVRYVTGASDARIQQPFDYPNFTVNVDRTRAQAIGFTQKDVAQSLLVALSGSFQTTPSFYLDPRNGVSYNVAVQTPQYRLDSMSALQSLPVTSASSSSTGTGTITSGTTPSSVGSAPAPLATNAPGAPQRPVQILGNLAQFQPGAELGTVSHYDVQPVLDIYANVVGTDLGSVHARDGEDQGKI